MLILSLPDSAFPTLARLAFGGWQPLSSGSRTHWIPSANFKRGSIAAHPNAPDLAWRRPNHPPIRRLFPFSLSPLSFSLSCSHKPAPKSAVYRPGLNWTGPFQNTKCPPRASRSQDRSDPCCARHRRSPVPAQWPLPAVFGSGHHAQQHLESNLPRVGRSPLMVHLPRFSQISYLPLNMQTVMGPVPL